MPKLASETIGINLFNFETERRCAFITMKNGFIISDGCNEKYPKSNHELALLTALTLDDTNKYISKPI